MRHFYLTNSRLNSESVRVFDLLVDGTEILHGVPYMESWNYLLANMADDDTYSESEGHSQTGAMIRADQAMIDAYQAGREVLL